MSTSSTLNETKLLVAILLGVTAFVGYQIFDKPELEPFVSGADDHHVPDLLETYKELTFTWPKGMKEVRANHNARNKHGLIPIKARVPAAKNGKWKVIYFYDSLLIDVNSPRKDEDHWAHGSLIGSMFYYAGLADQVDTYNVRIVNPEVSSSYSDHWGRHCELDTKRCRSYRQVFTYQTKRFDRSDFSNWVVNDLLQLKHSNYKKALNTLPLYMVVDGQDRIRYVQGDFVGSPYEPISGLEVVQSDPYYRDPSLLVRKICLELKAENCFTDFLEGQAEIVRFTQPHRVLIGATEYENNVRSMNETLLDVVNVVKEIGVRFIEIREGKLKSDKPSGY